MNGLFRQAQTEYLKCSFEFSRNSTYEIKLIILKRTAANYIVLFPNTPRRGHKDITVGK